MRLEFSIGKIINLFFKGKKNIFNLGIIILTLIIVSSVYRNQNKTIESLNIKKETEIKKNEVLNEISRSEKKFKSYGNLLGKKDATSVVDTIKNLAKDSGVEAISVKPGTEEVQLFYIKYPFILVISADSYHAIGKFIDKIESHPDVYFVDAISIRSQQESETLDKESAQMPKSANRLIVDLILSIIAFKG